LVSLHFFTEQSIGSTPDDIDPVDFGKEFLRAGLKR